MSLPASSLQTPPSNISHTITSTGRKSTVRNNVLIKFAINAYIPAHISQAQTARPAQEAQQQYEYKIRLQTATSYHLSGAHPDVTIPAYHSTVSTHGTTGAKEAEHTSVGPEQQLATPTIVEGHASAIPVRSTDMLAVFDTERKGT